MAEQIIKKSVGEAISPMYKTYALSVITDRALPDIRSGVKPVLKRTLYAMIDLGVRANSSHKKSARIVGDVLGKYHPHGDTSVYEAMVRAGQDWNMRYPLVDIHGNEGSVDGDSPAAMRYTGARLTKIGEAMLSDIKKDTVDFVPNYDDTELEPTTLPCKLPMLFANGVEGIAVTMATTIPPHNMHELLSASKKVIDNILEDKETTIEELMENIKGPDFPTGGTIVSTKELQKAYETGKGKITLRGHVNVVNLPYSHKAIEITSLPFQTKPIDIVAKINELKNDDSIEGIKEVLNESEKGNLKIVVYLRKNVNPELVINQLYKKTDLQKNISFNMNALSENGKPIQLSLKAYIESYIKHSLNVLLRASKYDLEKALKRISNIESIKAAMKDIPGVMKVISEHDTPKEELMKILFIDENQAEYLLDIKLRSLAKQNMEKINAEYEELKNRTLELHKIINDKNHALKTLKSEIETLDIEFGDKRKTNINTSIDFEISDEDLIKDEALVVTVTSDGLIKAVEEKEYSTQKRGGTGSKVTTMKNDEIVTDIFSINSKDDILFMSNIGRCHKLKGYDIPKVSKSAKGKHMNNFLKLEDNEKIVTFMPVNLKEEGDSSVLFVTALGTIKRLQIKELQSKYSSLRALIIKEGDSLQTCLKVKEGEDVLLCTANGQSARFTICETNKKPIRPQGRNASGVQGIKLSINDYVVGATIIDNNSNVLTLTKNGLAKKTKGSNWDRRFRGGKGVSCHKIDKSTGLLTSVLAVNEDDEIFVATEQGNIIRLFASSISSSSRLTFGSKALKLKENDFALVASLAPKSIEEEKE